LFRYKRHFEWIKRRRIHSVCVFRPVSPYLDIQTGGSLGLRVWGPKCPYLTLQVNPGYGHIYIIIAVATGTRHLHIRTANAQIQGVSNGEPWPLNRHRSRKRRRIAQREVQDRSKGSLCNARILAAQEQFRD